MLKKKKKKEFWEDFDKPPNLPDFKFFCFCFGNLEKNKEKIMNMSLKNTV